MKQGNRGQPLSARAFSGRCLGCNKIDHKKVDCPSSARSVEVLFMARLNEKLDWLIDSGAPSRMIPERKNFQTYRELKETLVLQLLMVNHSMWLVRVVFTCKALKVA
ncbi:uncharacterized protein PHALS_07089 [Plasmopara halstedii]|uniref:Uncharacterized protein n=1 Tax=Plasmopara halstedii TaxID=4781 RepID=A0A0P1B565_PLAHL|nr:uncharacterized protein PHALS_07089 [Plasmopara halstedii]CEG49319.1 hypothetical protein PHALS_07089 [Plasmopara halstedii]|eukprot:XP_024585688.1 hypothetical protein PHALS_07089 [Plasmopara halstedii]